jgi:hypothetical protein
LLFGVPALGTLRFHFEQAEVRIHFARAHAIEEP